MAKPETDAFLSARENLIAEDRALRLDNALLKNATEEEVRAEQIIREIRAEEARNVWSMEHEDVPNTFPGMAFLSGEHERAYGEFSFSKCLRS